MNLCGNSRKVIDLKNNVVKSGYLTFYLDITRSLIFIGVGRVHPLVTDSAPVDSQAVQALSHNQLHPANKTATCHQLFCHRSNHL